MRRTEDDDWEDPDYGDDDYGDDDNEPELVPCPECGGEVYEDAEQCPHCGQYIKPGGSKSVLSGRPLWFIALAIAGIIAVIVTSFR